MGASAKSSAHTFRRDLDYFAIGMMSTDLRDYLVLARAAIGRRAQVFREKKIMRISVISEAFLLR